jgi:hypothetical protein
MNATIADLLTKPLTKIHKSKKLRKMTKSIIGQQECVGATKNRANNNTVPLQYGTGNGTKNNSTGTFFVPVLVLVIKSSTVLGTIPQSDFHGKNKPA